MTARTDPDGRPIPRGQTATRRLTAWMRARPHFVIIGAMKCGTSSLFSYLARHESVVPPTRKEVHFFDHHFGRGTSWYRAHFPLRRPRRRRWITGEATPYYIFHPTAAERIHAQLPHAKLVALFRDPVKRAFSHYQHEVANGNETLSFEEALEREAERLDGEAARMRADPGYFSRGLLHHSYLARGRYLEQLERWHALFPREQLLVLKAEELYSNTQGVVDEVTDFLALDRLRLESYGAVNTRSYEAMAPRTEAWLYDYFRPHNAKLFEYLGRDFGWNPRADATTPSPVGETGATPTR